MTARPLLSLLVLALVTGCGSSVVGGGSGAGGGGVGGDGGTPGDDVASAATGAGAGDAVTTGANPAGGDGATTAGSTGSGLSTERSGVVVPRDEEKVDLLLGNVPQSCEEPLHEPPCDPERRWIATFTMPRALLAPGTYLVFGGDIGANGVETDNDCEAGGGFASPREGSTMTVESIDAETVTLRFDDVGWGGLVEGVWEVPLCAGVEPAR